MLISHRVFPFGHHTGKVIYIRIGTGGHVEEARVLSILKIRTLDCRVIKCSGAKLHLCARFNNSRLLL